jgi:hypothetical protein
MNKALVCKEKEHPGILHAKKSFFLVDAKYFSVEKKLHGSVYLMLLKRERLPNLLPSLANS